MINDAGIALLKEFERGKDPDTGKLLPVGVPATKAYNDMPDESGEWTISWGLTGPDIKRGTVWTAAICESEFVARVSKFEQDVLAECVVEPNENQLAAMVCLAFNTGMGWKGKRGPRDRDGFRQSTVLRLHNQSNFTGAANAFGMWNKSGGQVRAGLTRRRASEMALYLTPVDEDRQTKRATPDTKDPATSKIDVGKLAAAVSTAAVGVQTTVSSVSGAWDAIAQALDPRYLVWGLALVAVGATAYFVIEAIQRRKEGK